MSVLVETEFDHLSAAINEIQYALPAEHYGWQEAIISGGLLDAALYCNLWETRTYLGLVISTSLQDGRHAFVCDTGSVLALDILKAHGITGGRLMKIEERDAAFEFPWDAMVVMPDRRAIRIAPMFPLVDSVSTRWTLTNLDMDDETQDSIRLGMIRQRIDQQDALPLKSIRTGSCLSLISIGFVQASDDLIMLTLSATKNDGNGHKEDMDVLFSVPRTRNIASSKPNIGALLKRGLSTKEARLIQYVYDEHEKRIVDTRHFEPGGWFPGRNFFPQSLPHSWKELLEIGIPALEIFVPELVRLTGNQDARLLWDVSFH